MNELKTDIADCITKGAAHEHRGYGRQKINSDDLAKIAPIIGEIPDEEIASRIRSYFVITGKYSALALIVNPDSAVWRKYPDIAARIAGAATETERAVVESYKR